MKVVTEIIASSFTLYCPYCGEKQYGFDGDISGEVFECDDCGKSFTIHDDVDIETE